MPISESQREALERERVVLNEEGDWKFLLDCTVEDLEQARHLLKKQAAAWEAEVAAKEAEGMIWVPHPGE